MIIGRQQTGRHSLDPIKENFKLMLAKGSRVPRPLPVGHTHSTRRTDEEDLA